MFGTFGYELDLEKMPEEEIQVVKEQIRFMKKYRRLIQIESDFYRLLSPFKGNETGWICVSPDKKTALAGFYQRLNKVNASWIRFKLAGLSEDVKYKLSYRVCDETRGYAAYGDELMSVGIPIDREDLTALGGDFASIVFEISAE
jgi:alpha-galactosidase